MLTGRTGQYTSSSSGYELAERWQRPINTDRMRPVMFSPHWNLTDVLPDAGPPEFGHLLSSVQSVART